MEFYISINFTGSI